MIDERREDQQGNGRMSNTLINRPEKKRKGIIRGNKNQGGK